MIRDTVEKVINFFAKELGASSEAEKLALVEKFMSSETQPPVKKTLVRRSNSSASRTHSDTNCKCAYVIKKKNGDLEVCGKNAKNEYDGKFYCGAVDKAGHYQSTIKNAVKKPEPSKPVTTSSSTGGVTRSATTGTATTTAAVTTGGGTSRTSQSLLERLKTNSSASTTAAYKIPGTEFYVIREKRILINIRNNEAYGLLHEDNKTVLPLNEVAIAYLKEKNIFYTTPKGNDDPGEDENSSDEVVDEESEDEDAEDEEDEDN